LIFYAVRNIVVAFILQFTLLAVHIVGLKFHTMLSILTCLLSSDGSRLAGKDQLRLQFMYIHFSVR